MLLAMRAGRSHKPQWNARTWLAPEHREWLKPVNMKKITHKLLVCVLLSIACLNASAALIRYDVEYVAAPGSNHLFLPDQRLSIPSFSGFMMFDITSSGPADIWQDIVYWSFTIDGNVINTGNTFAVDDGFFFVDAERMVVSDSRTEIEYSPIWRSLIFSPAFLPLDPHADTPNELRFFGGNLSRNLARSGAIIFAEYAGSRGGDSSGSLFYSEPFASPSSIPIPGTLVLILSWIGLTLRNQGKYNRGRRASVSVQ